MYQSITFRMADSLPKAVVERLIQQEDDVQRRIMLEAQLDAGHGSCALREPAHAQIVMEALQHFDGERYCLITWVVMPNHVHVLIQTVPDYPLAKVVHSWKRHTAARINGLRGSSGAFWQREYWDRFIRDEQHFASCIHYIDHNPVKAGLVTAPAAWPWGRAGFSPLKMPAEKLRTEDHP